MLHYSTTIRIATNHSFPTATPSTIESISNNNITNNMVPAAATTTKTFNAMSFPHKLHTLLEDAATSGFDDVISWQQGGTSFKVHKPDAFVTVMQAYFNQTKFKSFQRQLNLWGFKLVPVGLCKGGYHCKFFLRESPDLCTHMARRRSRDFNNDNGNKVLESLMNELQQDLLPALKIMINQDVIKEQQQQQRRRRQQQQQYSAQPEEHIHPLGLQHKESMLTWDEDIASNFYDLFHPKTKDTTTTDVKSSFGADRVFSGAVALSDVCSGDSSSLRKLNNNNNNNDNELNEDFFGVGHLDCIGALPSSFHFQHGHDFDAFIAATTMEEDGEEEDDSSILLQTWCLQEQEQDEDSLLSSLENDTNDENSSSSSSPSDFDDTCFPYKLHLMLENAEFDNYSHIVSWVKDGTAFQVHDSKAFVAKVLPLYFDQSKYESFRRQLNLYGFTRQARGADRGVLSHPYFLAKNRSLCEEIKRARFAAAAAMRRSSLY